MAQISDELVLEAEEDEDVKGEEFETKEPVLF